MIIPIFAACTAGILIGMSRQINGRLSLSTSPLIASTWSHIVGFVFLSALGILVGGLFPPGIISAPWHAYLGGVFGVLYVVGGSWAILRIGAAHTALLVVGGQVLSGVVLDILSAAHIPSWELCTGVVLIVVGVVLIQRQRG